MPTTNAQSTVLVTGNNGFTGRHLVAHLRSLKTPPRIVGFDLIERPDADVDEQFVGDLGQVDAVSRVLDACRPSTIIHLAGLIPPADDVELWAANVGATFNLIEAIRSQGSTPRMLAVGSAAEYGPVGSAPIREDHPCRPATAYGRTKLAQTLLCQRCCDAFGVPIVLVRPFNLFGPGMPPRTVIGEICAQIVRARPDRTIHLGNLRSARDFVDIRDAVRAYWTVAERGEPGRVYNVCTGRATPISELVDMLLSLAGEPYTVVSSADRFQSGDVDHSCGDCGALTQLCGSLPGRELRDSLRDTLDAVRSTRTGHAPHHP